MINKINPILSLLQFRRKAFRNVIRLFLINCFFAETCVCPGCESDHTALLRDSDIFFSLCSFCFFIRVRPLSSVCRHYTVQLQTPATNQQEWMENRKWEREREKREKERGKKGTAASACSRRDPQRGLNFREKLWWRAIVTKSNVCTFRNLFI